MAARTALVSRKEARLYLLGHLGLKQNTFSRGDEGGVEEVLKALRCIQVDSLDPMGYSHELVVMARTDGLPRGTMFRHLPDGSYFEHWAKERCILPASAFPYYHNKLRNNKKAFKHWWYSADREDRLRKLVISTDDCDHDSDTTPSDEEASTSSRKEKKLRQAVNQVLKEVSSKGPQINSSRLTEIGTVKPLSWSGWKGTKYADLQSGTALALEMLWGECRVVITRGKGRDSKEKLYSTPEAIFLPDVVDRLNQPMTDHDFAKWAVLDRVEAAGLLPRVAGPHWSVFEIFRNAPIIDTLLEAGDIEEVQIEGSRSRYLAPKGWRERKFPDFDDRMRIIAPLDPIVWHRPLVQHLFGFEYVWEVYKKEAKRLWGWYVCPLLYKGYFVGRLEGKVEGDALVIKNVWKEEMNVTTSTKNKKLKEFNEDAFRAMLKRHAELCGVSTVIVNGQTMADDVPMPFSSRHQLESVSAKTKRKKRAEEDDQEEEATATKTSATEVKNKTRRGGVRSRAAKRRKNRQNTEADIEKKDDEEQEDIID